ncbi:hypothetical protein LRAMOSA05000 [Lichtheimia ramosa]|uniref:Carbohydrate esterase family 16 protein n=1 Tax=Lichtheimia ramosa TaxID=688394 RepID=A0A077WYX8_9FUNG|nr:hypothetical protein LRAMOSA05000 [Lichtheimia ramosa]
MVAFGQLSLFLVTLLTNSANIVSAAPSWTSKGFCWDEIDNLFVFGDSYTYTEGKLGTPWYSWNNFTSPSDVHHDPILLNKTSADGPNWVEYLTNCFEGLPQTCHPHLYNFAYGGADIDPTAITKHDQYTKSFVEQIDQWKVSVNDYVPWKPSNTLAAFWIGINDVGDTWEWTNASNKNTMYM